MVDTAVRSSTAPVARTRRGGRAGRLPVARILSPVVSVVGGLAILELLVRADVISAKFFPTPTAIASELGDRLASGALADDLGATLKGVILSVLISTAIAVPIGILLGSMPLVHRSFRFIIEFLRPLPSVAIIPLIVLIFGSTTQSKVVLATFGAIWPLLIMVMEGVAGVDPVANDSGRAYGLGRLQRARFITLPSALPFAATGLRLSIVTALLLTVTSEIVIGVPGIGRTLNMARINANPELMYAMIVVTGMLGIVLNAVARLIERRTLRWHPSQRSASGADA